VCEGFSPPYYIKKYRRKKEMENTETVVQDTEVKEEQAKVDDVKGTTEKTEKHKDDVNNVDKVDEKDAPKTEKTEKTTSLELENANKTVEELTSKLDEATKQLADLDAVKKELADAKAEINKTNETVKGYEDLLNQMIDEKMKAIPEEYAELVPSNMTIVQQLEWLVKAEAKNLFRKDKTAPNVEIGKPMGAKTDAKADTSKMTNSGILSMAYNVLKK
jgi:ribonucleoside-triphosphate reductase